MKALLAILLCLVFGTAQTYAIKGGPGYGSHVSTTGNYAGVMTPGPRSPGANSIGIFSMAIPKTGLGSGTVIIFEAGQTYSGTFQGTADPDTANLFGEISASFPYVEFVTSTDSNGHTTTTGVTVSATAAGQLNGKIRANTNAYSSAGTRISGDCDIQFSLTVNNPFNEIDYIVSGFKQSEIGQ